VLAPVTDDVGARATRRISLRLLPFVFLLYVICQLDRTNVSFANLHMSADLGLSDRTYGLGVGLFFLGYVLFEIPGALVVERWSARKWIARIMITWGMVTVGMGFVETAGQFYVARLLLGIAEASFFPGVIVYLTHWFPARNRAKAIASFFSALPASSVLGSFLASWLLEVHWMDIAGWRWIFIVEGIPPMVFGIITLFYLPDRPQHARWLAEDERNWLTAVLDAEKQAKKKVRDFTIWQAVRDGRVLMLVLSLFVCLCGLLSITYWLPTFIKRLSGLPGSQVALLVAIPGVLAIAGMLLNGWHSDATGERRWHASIPVLCGGLAYLVLALGVRDFPVAMTLFAFGSGALLSFYPVFWSMPTLVLSESAAAVCVALINSVGQIGGFVGPYIVGYLNDRTGGMTAAFAFIAACLCVGGSTIPMVRIRNPIAVGSASPERA
jgi:ACS family tartrate transporter-like MFS transporter